MMLVDPSYRRTGIGTRLLEEALLFLDDMPTVRLDATPAGFHLYQPSGFREEYRLQRMERRPSPAVTLPDASVRQMADANLDEVFEWDTRVFGADRRGLLESFRRQAPMYARIAGSPISGYTFGRPGHLFEHIGPVVARDEETASSLVAGCLAASPDRPFIIDVPIHASWVRRLESQQFVLQRPFIRMQRGHCWNGHPPCDMFAIAGPEFA
jgi:hypothetical protein